MIAKDLLSKRFLLSNMKSVPRLDDVLAHIDSNQDRYLGYVADLVRRPSISAENTGIAECAEYVRQMMQRLGLETKILPTGGNPVVYGECGSPNANRTILFYNHYDVQPTDPADQWLSKPFEPVVRDGKLYGRGTADNKGTFASRIAALESVLAVLGDCPVNVKFLVEGEEEIGSPNLALFAEKNREQLKADAIVWEGSSRDPSERPAITLGFKGMLSVELRDTGPKADQHSSKAPIIPNPAWRLVWALASMKSADERIQVEGFSDKIRPPSKEMQDLLHRVPFDLQKELDLVGLERLAGSEDPVEIKKRLFFEPTMTINGVNAGYLGRGVKTIVPGAASAKIDIRLVPDQDPDDILRKIQNHLKRHGFGDIEVKALARMCPCRTDPETPIARTAVKTAREVYGLEPIVYPNHIASGAMYVATEILRKPAISIGAAYYGSAMHSPNEHIRVGDFILAIKHIAAILLSRF